MHHTFPSHLTHSSLFTHKPALGGASRVGGKLHMLHKETKAYSWQRQISDQSICVFQQSINLCPQSHTIHDVNHAQSLRFLKPPPQLLSLFKLYTYQWNHHPSCCRCSNSIHTSETTTPAVVVVQTLYIPVKPPPQLLSLFKLYTYQWNHHPSCCHCSNSIHTSDNFSDWKNVTTPYESKQDEWSSQNFDLLQLTVCT